MIANDKSSSVKNETWPRGRFDISTACAICKTCIVFIQITHHFTMSLITPLWIMHIHVSIFIYLFTEGLYIAQSTAQGQLRAFHKFQFCTSWIPYKTCTLHKHTNIIQNLVPLVLILSKMANTVRRCWYHWPFRSGVSIPELKKRYTRSVRLQT